MNRSTVDFENQHHQRKPVEAKNSRKVSKMSQKNTSLGPVLIDSCHPTDKKTLEKEPS